MPPKNGNDALTTGVWTDDVEVSVMFVSVAVGRTNQRFADDDKRCGWTPVHPKRKAIGKKTRRDSVLKCEQGAYLISLRFVVVFLNLEFSQLPLHNESGVSTCTVSGEECKPHGNYAQRQASLHHPNCPIAYWC